MASRSSRRSLSEAKRAERRRQDRERLQRAAEELLSSEWVGSLGACPCDVPRFLPDR